MGNDSESADLVGPQPRNARQLSVFVREMAEHGIVAEAARKCNVTERCARGWLSFSRVISEIHKERERIINAYGASVGLRVLRELAENLSTPSNTRLGAARELLALAGHSAAQAAADATKARAGAALQDMDADQLERMIAGAAATLQQLRRQASVVDVAPDKAPDAPDPASLL